MLGCDVCQFTQSGAAMRQRSSGGNKSLPACFLTSGFSRLTFAWVVWSILRPKIKAFMVKASRKAGLSLSSFILRASLRQAAAM